MAVPFLYETTPRFSDTDAYGVVHHSNYYKWLEEARIAFTQAVLGFTMQDFEARQIKFPVLEASCQYKLPVLYGDPLRIEVWITIAKAAKWTFTYRILHAKTGRIHAVAKTVHAYLGPDGRMLLNHPDWFQERVEQALREHPGKYLAPTPGADGGLSHG
jgi:acyl-CoA thioester hydrolase